MSSLVASHLVVEREGRSILNDASLELGPGRLVGLVGPNGSGKSTLLRCLAGLWFPSAGEVALEGRDLRIMPRREISKRIAYVPQETSFGFDFSVRETVLMGRYSHRGRFERQTKEDIITAEDALRRTDVLHLADRSVRTLSGGERQRVLIARSLASQALILLLDEPTANLDVNHALDVLDLCRGLSREGSTIAIATHDLNSIVRYVDEVALMDNGRIAAAGSPDRVLTAENLARAFNVRSETLHSNDGTRMFVFHRIGQV